ncbi:MAG TPA: response regulator transcription factor [Candidatus Paceibacterota bacterium]|nr:response regulator transcription factor [Candidatus Paceibacterota bacterium]
MRILVIDDDPDIRGFLKEKLSSEGFTVDTAGDGAEGSYMARVNEYDALILDNVMPRKNGKEVLKEVRASGKNMPVLALSVMCDIDDKIELLDLGADDYITKPFSAKELVSRLRALVRRPAQIILPVLTAGDLVLDTARQRAIVGEREVYLTRKEFALAECLLRSAGAIVSRGTLLESVWESDADHLSNTIEVHMRNLRRKIDGDSRRKIIHTAPGRGYWIGVQDKVMR